MQNLAVFSWKRDPSSNMEGSEIIFDKHCLSAYLAFLSIELNWIESIFLFLGRKEKSTIIIIPLFSSLSTLALITDRMWVPVESMPEMTANEAVYGVISIMFPSVSLPLC